MAVLTRLLLAVAVLAIVASCDLIESRLAGPPVPADERVDDRFPDVLAAELRPRDDGRYDLAVTISSPYDTPARFADGWRVLDPAGNELGTHQLLHDHASEQPFTRTMRGLHIPAGVDRITVEGRDLQNGYGGTTVSLEVPT